MISSWLGLVRSPRDDLNILGEESGRQNDVQVVGVAGKDRRQSPRPLHAGFLENPIVGGVAIKGPAAKMMRELNIPVTALGVAQHSSKHYPGLLDYFVIDESDATLTGPIGELGLQVAVAPTIMKSRQDKQRLAEFLLGLVKGRAG